MAKQEHLRSLAHTQNFLRSGRLVQALVQSAALGSDDLVVEIGPGRGVITEALARRCREVIAVEADGALVAFLRKRFAEYANVRIVCGDFLRFALPRAPYKVFANIPFDRTAAILAKLTNDPFTPEDCYLGLQAEAAERFVGEPRETLVSALLKPSFAPSVVYRFCRTDFAPVPRVDVVMLRLRKRGPPLVTPGDFALYRDFVTFCFSARCPSLRETLRAVVGGRRSAELLDGVQLRREVTPSQVRFDAWLALFDEFLTITSVSDRRLVQGSYSRLLHRQSRLVRVHRTRPPPDRCVPFSLGGPLATAGANGRAPKRP